MTATNGTITRRLNKHNANTHSRAMEQAKATGNEWMVLLLSGINPKKTTSADRALMADFLGEE